MKTLNSIISKANRSLLNEEDTAKYYRSEGILPFKDDIMADRIEEVFYHQMEDLETLFGDNFDTCDTVICNAVEEHLILMFDVNEVIYELYKTLI